MSAHFSFGEFILIQRRRRGMTQEEFAQLIHIHENTVRRWERGMSTPNIAEVPYICRNLGVTPNQLFRWEGEEDAHI